jgi:hypothetical protein
MATVTRLGDVCSGFTHSVVLSSLTFGTGSCILVIVRWNDPDDYHSTVTGVSSSVDGSLSVAASGGYYHIGSSNRGCKAWYVAASAGGSGSITVSFDGTYGADGIGVWVFDIAGADASPIDGSDGFYGYFSSNPVTTAGQVTVSAPGTIFFAGQVEGVTVTAGSGFGNCSMVSGGNGHFSEWKTGVSASQNATCTASIAGTYAYAIAVAVKDASGGGGAVSDGFSPFASLRNIPPAFLVR